MKVNLYTDLDIDEAIHKYLMLMKNVKTTERAKEILNNLRSILYKIFHERVRQMNMMNENKTTATCNPESLNVRFNIYVSDCPHYLKGTTGAEKNGPLLIINIIGDRMDYVWDDIDIKGTTDSPPDYVLAIADMARYQ